MRERKFHDRRPRRREDDARADTFCALMQLLCQLFVKNSRFSAILGFESSATLALNLADYKRLLTWRTAFLSLSISLLHSCFLLCLSQTSQLRTIVLTLLAMSDYLLTCVIRAINAHAKTRRFDVPWSRLIG